MSGNGVGIAAGITDLLLETALARGDERFGPDVRIRSQDVRCGHRGTEAARRRAETREESPALGGSGFRSARFSRCQAGGECRQRTVSRIVSAGVIVSVGVAPSLRATR